MYALACVLCMQNVFSVLLLSTGVFSERSAHLDVHLQNKSLRENYASLQLKGTYSKAGAVKNVEGTLHEMPNKANGIREDQSLITEKPGDWIAILHYPSQEKDGKAFMNGTNCQSVLDRVKDAMLLGASAIIILALNPKFMKELDIGQLFSKPVILIHGAENITAMLNIIFHRISARIAITQASSLNDAQKLKTVSMWSTCGRPNPGDGVGGVVCFYQNELNDKADPGQYWSYFYSIMFTVMMILLMKAKGRDEEGEEDALEQVETSLRRLASQALAVMKIRRYNKSASEEYDTCAVCLDVFHCRQKIRILPCSHEFHPQCVDPWLIKHRTCPLCKLNIIDQHIKAIL